MFNSIKGSISGVWEWIMLIFNLLKSSPEIIGLFEDLVKLIKDLTGGKGEDESAQVKLVKSKSDQIQKKIAPKMAKLVKLHDQK